MLGNVLSVSLVLFTYMFCSSQLLNKVETQPHFTDYEIEAKRSLSVLPTDRQLLILSQDLNPGILASKIPALTPSLSRTGLCTDES